MRFYYHWVFKFLKDNCIIVHYDVSPTRQRQSFFYCLLRHKIQIDTIHTYSVGELAGQEGRGGEGRCPCQLIFLLRCFLLPKIRGDAPSLDLPLYVYFIATPYKGF